MLGCVKMSAIFKNRRSGIFLLCIILATAIFVGVVCFVINDRNQKIINGDTLYETEKIEETENKENNLPVFNEEEVIDTTITYEEQLPIPPTPGTLNEPTIITIDEALTSISEEIKEVKEGVAWVYKNGTLGGGGHSYEIAKRLSSGRLICIDQDDAAIAAAEHIAHNGEPGQILGAAIHIGAAIHQAHQVFPGAGQCAQ